MNDKSTPKFPARTEAELNELKKRFGLTRIGKKEVHFFLDGLTKLIHGELDRLAHQAQLTIDTYYNFVARGQRSGYRGKSRLAIKLSYKNHVLHCSWREVVSLPRSKRRYAKHIKRDNRHRKLAELAKDGEIKYVRWIDEQLEVIRKQAKSLHAILRRLSHLTDVYRQYDEVANRPDPT